MQLLGNATSPFVRIVRICMIEKGLHVEHTIVDPWADDKRLRAANAATRVPSLILDDGTPLTESLLIVQWLEATYPAPKWPSLFGTINTTADVLSRAGVAIGAIEASVHTIITRKVTAPTLFDDTPVGLRRRRTMIESQLQLEAFALGMGGHYPVDQPPTLDIICAVVLFDYQQLRYADQSWLPKTPALQELSTAMRKRTSIADTLPRIS